MVKSPHELNHELEQLGSKSTTTSPVDVSVDWRDADPESRPTGMSWTVDDGEPRLSYDLWGAQQDTLNVLEDDDGDQDVIALLAGYGSGKSVFGARWMIACALKYPGSRFLAMGVDFQKARDATYRVLFEQLPGDRTDVVTSSFNGPENSPIVEDYNRRENRLTLANDSVIKLGSADKWSRYAGDEYGGLWLDEPSHYRDLHDLLEMLGSRLRGVDGPKQQLWTLTGNGYNAAWQILEKREDADGEPLGLNIELIRASTEENPYLDPSDVERFRRQYEGTGREEQALRGGFAAAQGLVYSNFSRETHVVDHADALDLVGEKRTFGYDAGWRDPRVLLELGETSYGQLIVIDEFHKPESHVEAAIAWLEDHGKPRGTVYAEHEPADIEKFGKAGWPAKKAQKSIDAGISEVRERFETDEAGRPGLLISEQCEHLIRELQGYKEDDVGTSAAEDHCCDALRYAVFTPVASPERKSRTRRGTPSDLARSRDSSSSSTSTETTSGRRREVRRRSPGGR